MHYTVTTDGRVESADTNDASTSGSSMMKHGAAQRETKKKPRGEIPKRKTPKSNTATPNETTTATKSTNAIPSASNKVKYWDNPFRVIFGIPDELTDHIVDGY